MQSYKKNKIVFLYFLYILLSYILFLFFQLEQFPNKYVYTDWLINYEGGFVRRGLIGQVIYELSNFTDFKIKNLILFFQIGAYLIYTLFFVYFFSKIKINFFWLLFIFSSISFLYPIGELEALGRKDIFVLLLFLAFTLIRASNLNSLFFYFFTIFSVSCLIHEITFFYIYYYFLVFYFKYNFFLKERINLKHLFFTLIIIFALIFLNLYVGESAKLSEMISSYSEKNIKISVGDGAISWLSKPVENHFFNVINKISAIGILRYTFIFLINLLPIFYFIRINENFVELKNNIKKIILIIVLFSLPIYILALDWGRITYLNYNFLIIFLIFLFKTKIIDSDYIERKSKKISKIKKIVAFSSICLIFSPKILLTDDLGTIPLYKALTKLLKLVYYNL